MPPPFVGPHNGDPRSSSVIFLQFVLSLGFCVVNSWVDVGYTRRPPLSKPLERPGHLDWILVRGTAAVVCTLDWPSDWGKPDAIKTDHAIAQASAQKRQRLPYVPRQLDPRQRLRAWQPPQDILATKLEERGTLEPVAWTWLSAQDDNFPREALYSQHPSAPSNSDLADSIDIIPTIGSDLQTNMRLELFDST